VIGFADADPKVVDILERVRTTFAGLEHLSHNGDRYAASFSIGVATYPKDGRGIPALLSMAEERLIADRDRQPG